VVFVIEYAEMLIGPAFFFTVFFESLFIVIGVKPGLLTKKVYSNKWRFDPKHYSFLTHSITFTHLL
jgi:hypothetical protein